VQVLDVFQQPDAKKSERELQFLELFRLFDLLWPLSSDDHPFGPPYRGAFAEARAERQASDVREYLSFSILMSNRPSEFT
jgi:hypothetical protein